MNDKYKEEICEVLSVKKNSYVIDFKGFGILVQTKHQLDKSLIKNPIRVSYESDIGKIDFKYFPIYDL